MKSTGRGRISIKKKLFVSDRILRAVIIVACMVLQCWWFVSLADLARRDLPYIAVIYQYIPVIAGLVIFSRNTNSAFKMPWMVLIVCAPLFGICMYILFGQHNGTVFARRHFAEIADRYQEKLVQDPEIMKALKKKDSRIAGESVYIWKQAGFPVYRNTDLKYFGDAEEALEDQLRELEKAERFIFLEYHGIEEGIAFGKMREILVRKASEGVCVRILYDDLGSFMFLRPHAFIREMKGLGIECRRFNPVHALLNKFMGNRDHRKITIVDGKTAYTGGYNLADRYFHIGEPYGWWKDSGVRLRGDAVRSFTVMFLEMWDEVEKIPGTEDSFLEAEPGILKPDCDDAYVQPFSDSPLDHIHTGEQVYMNMLRTASEYVYISTPYLILTDEMRGEIISASQRGVDVKILVPGIPDKKIVYQETLSNCEKLVRAGVCVYRYRPGFNHAKQCVSDDETAMIGTINLDYRSFYYHFEDGVFVCGKAFTHDLKEDMDQMLLESEQITPGSFRGFRPLRLVWNTLLGLLSPLM